MNKIKLACISTLLIAGIAQASTPCDGFELKIKNTLPDDLLVNRIKLHHADIQPGGIALIAKNSEMAFTVNNSAENTLMNGTFEFKTATLPVKTIKINYTLENRGAICEHTVTEESGDYPVSKTRLPNKVDYTIG